MKNRFMYFYNFIAAFVLFTALSNPCIPETGLEGRKQVILENAAARAGIDIAGGSIVNFHLTGSKLNPLKWNYPESGDTSPRPMGHFICFDRWGQPSETELENGMPFHGEAPHVVWKVLSPPTKKSGALTAEILCELPIGGMTLKRTMTLYENTPVIRVREEITNINKLGRVYNIVQHPTIAPPFLDESVVVDSNAYRGYMQESPWPNPEEPVIYWPSIAYKGEHVDFRRLFDDPNPAVVSFVFQDGVEYGWVTACNPGKGLMLGYIWKLAEYPWLNIWRNVDKNGKPTARGLEFGTTGLHRPFGDMLAKRTIFGRTLCEYIDAGQTIVKSYHMFLSEIPANYNGVGNLEFSGSSIVIKEREPAGIPDIIITVR